MSKLQADTIATRDGAASTAMLNAINGSAKAWVSFNGTGTIAIRSGFNVSSLTDLAAGSWQVNFATAMVDVLYSAYTSVDNNQFGAIGTCATTSVSVTAVSRIDTDGLVDTANVNISVYR